MLTDVFGDSHAPGRTGMHLCTPVRPPARMQNFTLSSVICQVESLNQQKQKPKVNAMEFSRQQRQQRQHFCWLTAVRDKSRQRGQHLSSRGCTVYNVSILANCLSSVYRLEEDCNLMKEGCVRLTVQALRACSYKTEAEAWHQGFAHILFKGWMSVFVNRNDTDEHELVLSAKSAKSACVVFLSRWWRRWHRLFRWKSAI